MNCGKIYGNKVIGTLESIYDLPRTHKCERERGRVMEKELKEIDEAITSLWWGAEISDKAKLWWNDHYQEIVERELAK
jgi:hypothetical protein